MIQFITLALALLTVVLSMIIRSIDVLRFQAFGVDTFANLLYARKMKGGSLNLYKTGKIVYPPTLPWLLKHLEGRVSVRWMHIIPKIFDMLTSITVFLFTLLLTENESAALFALAFYTFSPINVINGYGIGTRNIGSFFFVSAILTSYLVTLNSQFTYAFFVLAVVSSVLMMLTSRIAYKSYFLLSIVLLFLSPVNIPSRVLLLVSATSLTLVLLVTGGKFIDDLKGQVFLINFFRKRKSKEKSIVKRIALVFYYDLWWCVGILAVVNGADLFLGAWLSTIVGLSFVWPWGEGERHAALATAPASILAATYLSGQNLMFTGILLLVEVMIVARISLKVLRGKYLVSVDKPLLNVFGRIRKIEGQTLVLCLPSVYSAPVAYFAEKDVLYGENSSEEGVTFQSEVLDAVETPERLERLISEYHVTHVFIDTQASSARAPEGSELVFQQNRFKVTKTNANNGG